MEDYKLIQGVTSKFVNKNRKMAEKAINVSNDKLTNKSGYLNRKK